MDNTTNNSIIGPGVNFYGDVKIKGKQVITSNIIHLAIREWAFDIVPRFELILNDDGMFTEVYPIQDGDIVSVKIRKPAAAKAIELDFIIMSYSAIAMHGNKFMQIAITGLLNITNFYSPIRYRSFHNMNSSSVLSQILTNEGNIALSSSISTNDTMTWIQTTSNMDFCKHILRRAYLANDCPLLYADSTGKFNYTSFKTEVDKKEEGIARYDITNYSADKFQNNADLLDYWFNSYSIHDYNTYVNTIRNYGMIVNYYDTKKGKKSINISDTSTPLTQLTSKNSNNINTISNIKNMGYMTSDNVHANYYTALAQNEYYKYNMFGGYLLELNINALSTPRLMGKVNVILPSLVGPGNNETLSGDHIIIGVVHDAIHGEVLQKRMLVTRNGANIAKVIKQNTVATSANGQTTPINTEIS